MSDVSRFKPGCLADDAVVVLPAELGLEESSFNVGGRFVDLDEVEVTVGRVGSSLSGLNFEAETSDTGGLFPARLLTPEFWMTP